MHFGCASNARAYLKDVTPSLLSWRLETVSISAFFLKSSRALLSNFERPLGTCLARIKLTTARSRPAKAGAVLGPVAGRVVSSIDLASICRATWSASAQSARVLEVRSFICSMSCSMRCQGTKRAAAMISTTAAPNKSWHLAAREMCNCRIRLNMQPKIVLTRVGLPHFPCVIIYRLSWIGVVWYDSSTQDNLTLPRKLERKINEYLRTDACGRGSRVRAPNDDAAAEAGRLHHLWRRERRQGPELC